MLATIPVAAQTTREAIAQGELNLETQALQVIAAAENAGAPTLAKSLYDDAQWRVRFSQENWNSTKQDTRDQARLRAEQALLGRARRAGQGAVAQHESRDPAVAERHHAVRRQVADCHGARRAGQHRLRTREHDEAAHRRGAGGDRSGESRRRRADRRKRSQAGAGQRQHRAEDQQREPVERVRRSPGVRRRDDRAPCLLSNAHTGSAEISAEPATGTHASRAIGERAVRGGRARAAPAGRARSRRAAAAAGGRTGQP